MVMDLEDVDAAVAAKFRRAAFARDRTRPHAEGDEEELDEFNNNDGDCESEHSDLRLESDKDNNKGSDMDERTDNTRRAQRRTGTRSLPSATKGNRYPACLNRVCLVRYLVRFCAFRCKENGTDTVLLARSLLSKYLGCGAHVRTVIFRSKENGANIFLSARLS